MPEIMRIDRISEYNDFVSMPTEHPLICVDNCDKMPPLRHVPKLYNVYCIFIKEIPCGEMTYGQGVYDYSHGSLIFIAPGQVMGGVDDGQLHQPKGYAMLFHPDLLLNTSLAKGIKEYHFFSYAVNEALALSIEMRKIIVDCMERIHAELLRRPIDRHSRTILVDHIRLLLDYCSRVYDDQFVRQAETHDMVTRFEKLMDNYFGSEILEEKGLPTVTYCADKLCLSPNYLSDLMRRVTGYPLRWHIDQKALNVAKIRLKDKSKSIDVVSQELGFSYSQHFSRWFKRMDGHTPSEYRKYAV